MDQPIPTFDSLLGREVVIDVASPFVYLGKLTGYDQKFVRLEQADVHDLRDTSTTRENYVVDARRFGIHSNRERVQVRQDEIISIAALDDVII